MEVTEDTLDDCGKQVNILPQQLTFTPENWGFQGDSRDTLLNSELSKMSPELRRYFKI